ncbi:predicted protein [Nematostella vectensis]|uniref:Uncharacterized protein n=1 Tax=Nematostella vectensis TaxID=45351 RepID=A7T0F6_NEMVE|nr:uncharacterized protein LOC5501361 [Nematostella vectensis]EDO30563.1 predicted protein [Nematostella vectensis]|eukprot:XP_001622663.1 predicted protein [Nematostella vectensis]
MDFLNKVTGKSDAEAGKAVSATPGDELENLKKQVESLTDEKTNLMKQIDVMKEALSDKVDDIKGFMENLNVVGDAAAKAEKLARENAALLSEMAGLKSMIEKLGGGMKDSAVAKATEAADSAKEEAVASGQKAAEEAEKQAQKVSEATKGIGGIKLW